MTITTLPPAPSRLDPTTFADKADAWVGAIDQWTTEANALGVDVSTKQTTASTAATTATNAATSAGTSATTATNAATSASASATAAAASAATAASITATSTSSLLIATGAKTFVTQTGKQFVAGQYLIISSAANVTNYMYGQVTSYSGTSLVMDIQVIGGSGTFADWNISISGARGASGTGITTAAVGWTGTGGTSARTLTVDTSISTSNVALLTGSTFTGNPRYTILDKGTVSTGTVTFDVQAAFEQRLQVGGALTVAFSNWPSSGIDCGVKIKMVNWGSAFITFPFINWQLPAGGYSLSFTTYLAAIGRASLQNPGLDFGVFWSDDGGSNIYGKLI